VSLPADVHAFPDEARRPRVKKLRLLLVLSGLGLLALVSTAFGMMMAVAAELPELTSQAQIREARNTVLVDYRGEELGILQGPENRVVVDSEDISRSMKRAIVSIEDRRFYENDGVDLRGTARALWQDILAGEAVQGGSTITQQFVKNKLQAQDERTVFNKLRETALAFHLSRKWDKDRVLTEYLNTIYFGNGAYGIESAARTYFGNQPQHAGCGQGENPPCASQLAPAEAALIAGVVASPSAYDPVARPVAAEQRRNLVLRRMVEQRLITRPQYDDALATSLPTPAQIQPPRERAATPQTPYFTTWVKQQVVERFGAREAFTGGLRVETSLDLDLQRAAETTVGRWLGNPAGPSAALVAIDNETGEVRAMIGGRDYNRSPFNLATQGRRQPGSAFKPFVLAAALQDGIGPGSVWSSRKKELTSRAAGCDFEVNNYEDAYAGATTLARATTTSDNSVYAEVGLTVGLRKIARLARRMGIRTPVSRNCAMTLGGLRQGVTPLDMAHAYHTFARRGRLVTGTLGDRRGPIGIREVRKRGEDEPGVENERRARRVLPEGIADTTTQILSTVVSQGTATRARLDEFAAGKTGTTENYGDAWFVGYTKRMTVAVWVGYPDETRSMLTEYRGEPVAGGTFPAEIWRDFMVAADRITDERVDESRRKRGLPPREDDPAETVPGAPVPGVDGVPAPATPAAPSTPAGDTGDVDGGAAPGQPAQAPQQAPPAPAPTQDPAPAPATPPAAEPAPTPATPAPAAPPSDAGGTGAPPAG
jgi:penicillin-binding protein 1A